MAVVIFKGFRVDLLAGNVNGSADLRVIPVMSATTADTDEDAVNLDDITTLDEFDGSGYTRLDLANVAVSHDDGDDTTIVTADAGSFGATVGAGSDDVVGFVYYRRVDGTAANDVAWAFNDTGELPTNPSGGDFELTPPPDGIIRIVQG